MVTFPPSLFSIRRHHSLQKMENASFKVGFHLDKQFQPTVQKLQFSNFYYLFALTVHRASAL